MRRHHRGGLALVIGLGLMLASASPAAAGPATERVREFFASANRIIVNPAFDARPDERLAALRRLVTEMVDFRNAAAIALGPEWSPRSAAERDEFVRLFTDLLETSVFASVGARARIDGGITVTYLDEVKDRDVTAVTTTVLTRSGREMSVGYRMARRQERWVVQDLVVDGVSLVDNYRAQFQKFIQRSSYAELVGEMRARIDDLGRTTPRVVTANAPAPLVVPARPGLAIVPAAPTIAAAVSLARESRPVETRLPEVHVSDRYWVQIGAFRSAEKAIQVATALRDQAISLLTAPDDPLLRVVLGPFANRDVATSKLREIRGRGYDAFISEASN